MTKLRPGFIDFIVEPTMSVCSDMLVKMVEPLVSMPTPVGNALTVNGISDSESNNGLLSPSPYEKLVCVL
jgi:hypothetical protein